ncbi:ribosomal protein S18-alanine N-acetyltransferase [Streptomyces syringium]|uniref:ribosomal protein S18-alanine N-acetyltransferase n=1 Tax=Streptomyces syringium TaxID=76729 RepID=UPI0034272AE4
MSQAVRIREMRWWDIAPVLELERALFPDDAWSKGLFWSELAHARGANANRRYVVAELPGGADGAEDAPGAGDAGVAGRHASAAGGPGTGAGTTPTGGRIVGYAGLAAIDGTGDVQTIAVAYDHWSTGLGARLLTELLTTATDFECREVLLEVRVDNTRAQRLYERFGFEPVGVRRGYYQPGNIDALVMRLATDAPATDPSGPAGSGESSSASDSGSAAQNTDQGMTHG